MIKLVARWSALALMPLCLLGCDVDQAMTFSTEGRINAAFPLSEAARSSKASMLELLPEAEHKAFEAEFNTRLKLRALGCANSYAPGWMTSLDKIRETLGDTACFTQADEGIAKWLNWRKVGLILAQPALKPVPAKPAAFIVADGSIYNVKFAEDAGVALIVSDKALQVMDFESTKPLFREDRESVNPGSISPNGRLFTSGDNNRLRIRDTRSGNTLAELTPAQPHSFTWLDSRTAFYNTGKSDKAVFLDLVSGQDMPLPEVAGGVQRVVPIPNAKDQYLLLSWRAVTKVEIVRGTTEPQVKLLAEKPADGVSWATNTSGLTADGKWFFNASRGLTLLSMDTLEVQTVALEPFRVQTGLPMPTGDNVLLTGFLEPHRGEAPMDLVYSISQQTVTPVDRSRLLVQRFEYLPSLHKLGAVSGNKIAVLDALPTTEATPLLQFIAASLEITNQRKLEMFEKQQQLQQQMMSQSQSSMSPSVAPARIGRF